MQKIKLPFKINNQKVITPIKGFFVKAPWFIAKRSFLFFLGILILILSIDGLIYRQYLWKVDVAEVEIEIEQVSINNEDYNKFLENYSARKNIFSRGSLEFHNIFFR